MSSFAGRSCGDTVSFPVGLASEGYGSPARMALAYSFASKLGIEKTEKSEQGVGSILKVERGETDRTYDVVSGQDAFAMMARGENSIMT